VGLVVEAVGIIIILALMLAALETLLLQLQVKEVAEELELKDQTHQPQVVVVGVVALLLLVLLEQVLPVAMAALVLHLLFRVRQ
jgi:hypothetical protein